MQHQITNRKITIKIDFYYVIVTYPVWGVSFGYIKWMKTLGVIGDVVCLKNTSISYSLSKKRSQPENDQIL